jgi:hypothetical protein
MFVTADTAGAVRVLGLLGRAYAEAAFPPASSARGTLCSQVPGEGAGTVAYQN